MIAYVYELICPIKKEPIYVGKTCDLYRRYKNHVCSIKNTDSRMALYFRGIGALPEINIIQKIRVKAYWDRRVAYVEAICIDAYKSFGYDLFNEKVNERTINEAISCGTYS